GTENPQGLMLPVGIDFASIQFGAARLLRLLAVPGGLLVLWVWQLARRRRDRRLYARSRTVPVRERIPLAGGLLFWLCLIAATPQIRLTKDPNTMFFFLDHLKDQPPLRLEDNNTWDTNIESGIYWGMRLIEKDEELHGKSKNAKAFVLVSDGQAWSGDVERSL